MSNEFQSDMKYSETPASVKPAISSYWFLDSGSSRISSVKPTIMNPNDQTQNIVSSTVIS